MLNILCLEISHQKPNSKKYILSNIYRLPNEIVQDVNTFTDEFSLYLSLLKRRKHSSFVCRDFNINLLSLDNKRHFNHFFDTVMVKCFFPRITLPTRIQNTSHTLIDNILSNNIEDGLKSKSGILINDISDHKIIFTYEENMSYVEKNAKYIEIEKQDELSLANFVEELTLLDIHSQLDHSQQSNPQDNYKTFSKLIKCAKDKHLPKRKVKYNRKKHGKSNWMTKGILNSINTKNALYKILIQTSPTNEDVHNKLKSEYTEYRAKLRKSIREAKRLYYLRLFAIHKNDIQKTWIVINNTLNNNSRNSRQSEFIVNNNKLTDPGDIANAFNDYFINIGRQLSDKIQSPHHYSDYLHNQVESHLQLKPISEIDTRNIINNLKNKASYGHDEISNKLIKRAGPALIKSLTLMVNQMLFTGIFPDSLKISKVKPLFKAGDPVLISNYRPILLLPSLSKIFEHIIFRQLFDYMTDNNLFAIDQYGFRSGHSTELAALHLIDYLTKQMDVGEIPINIYIDLSKAFDTLDHTILLAKLRYYGIRGVAHKLMLNYLSHRYQYVEYNGVQSSSQHINTGVPQGSILGPLLFLFYINDLPLVSPVFRMLMYADDTTLFCNINNDINDNEINRQLNTINEWLLSNKLSLNIKKTKYMVFHTNQRRVLYPNLYLNMMKIERVTQFNFLGIVLSSNLKWDKHTDHISKKISRAISVMYRLKQIYPHAVLLTLYQAIIYPHFIYGLLVWGSKIENGHPLHLLQKKALRIVANQDYIAHSEPICKALNLVKVPDMYTCAVWNFYYKLMINLLPIYFENCKPTLPRIDQLYNVRKPVFHLPKIKHKFAEQLPDYQLVKLLNKNGSFRISSKVFTHSKKGFSSYVKNIIIETYEVQCNIVNCVSCRI